MTLSRLCWFQEGWPAFRRHKKTNILKLDLGKDSALQASHWARKPGVTLDWWSVAVKKKKKKKTAAGGSQNNAANVFWWPTASWGKGEKRSNAAGGRCPDTAFLPPSSSFLQDRKWFTSVTIYSSANPEGRMAAGVQMEVLTAASNRACKRPNQIILMVLIAGRRSSLPGDKTCTRTSPPLFLSFRRAGFRFAHLSSSTASVNWC